MSSREEGKWRREGRQEGNGKGDKREMISEVTNVIRDGVVSFRLLSFRLLKINLCHFAYSPHM